MIRDKITAIFIILFFLSFFLNSTPYISKKESARLIRIAIIWNADTVTISGINHHNKILQNYTYSISDNLPVFVKPIAEAVIVRNMPYRGKLELKKIGNKIWVINILEIEDYLKGVVPSELGKIDKNLIEAAKAQAVAARSYAYAHLNRYPEYGFDLYAAIRDQVYGGIKSEDSLINEAIKATERIVLTYKGQPIKAKYHSTCGGYTVDFNDAWSGIAPQYLKSVECGYCRDSPYFQWQKRMSWVDFLKNLRNNLSKIGFPLEKKEVIKSLQFIRNPKSKRIINILIITNKREYLVPVYNIRALLGTPQDLGGLLKSNYFYFNAKNDSIIIDGRGFGHGVGMCQFGALGLAKSGKNYKEILRHYYHRTKLTRF